MQLKHILKKKGRKQTSAPTSSLTTSCSHSHPPPGLLGHAQGCQADRVDSEIILELLKVAEDLLFQHHPTAQDVCVLPGGGFAEDC